MIIDNNYYEYSSTGVSEMHNISNITSLRYESFQRSLTDIDMYNNNK